MPSISKPFDGGAAVHLADGRQFEAETVVVAAGAWSARLFLAPGRHDPAGDGTRLSCYAAERQRIAAAPSHACGSRFYRDPYGQRPSHCRQPWNSPASTPSRITGGLNRCSPHARAMFPVLQSETLDYWMGCRPSIPDSVPVIGHCPNAKSVDLRFWPRPSGYNRCGDDGAAGWRVGRRRTNNSH